MYKSNLRGFKSRIRGFEPKEALSLEQQIALRLQNGDDVDSLTKDGVVELIHTDPSMGVDAGTDIRTDTFDLALDVIDAKQKRKANKYVKKEGTTNSGNNDADLKVVKDND